MDVVRSRRRANPARALGTAAVVVLLGAAGYSSVTLLRPHSSDPILDRNAMVTDVAVRGDIVRAVRAPGTFVAQRVRIAAAPADGTVDAISVRVGSLVTAGTTIATMSDPDLDAAVVDARAQIVAARAELRSVQAEARAAQLDKSANVNTAVAQYREVREQAVRYRDLHSKGLVSDYENNVAQIKAGEARDAIAFDRRKIEVGAADAQAKDAVVRARIEQLTSALAAKEAARAMLVVRAGASGVVALIAVERGARIAAGTQIARIVGLGDLKATLDVPEAEIRDVVPGLSASIDSQNGVVAGHVARVDPAAQNGAIAVDVTIDGALPPNARPDLHVDGTIELERLRNVVSIARPANAADNTTIDIYALVEGRSRATRLRARLGSGSLDRIQVLSGITSGTTVIVSDTSSYNGSAALRVQ